MYMYTEKQIQNINSFGIFVKPKLVSELQQFDKVYYQTRVLEPNSYHSVTHYVEFFSWTLTEKCHCHIDWKYYERRNKHIRTLVDENGDEFEDFSIYMNQDRLNHTRHTMDSRRYAQLKKDKKPTREHLVMTCYDEELEPFIVSVYSDDVVFVLEDMSNIKPNIDVSIIGIPSEDEYFQPYVSEGLRRPHTFYNYVFNNPFNKDCVECTNLDIPYAQIHKGYFGDYDLKGNINYAYEDITEKLRLANDILKDKTYTESMAKNYDNTEFIYALRVLEDLIPNSLRNTISVERSLWKRFMKCVDIYNGINERYKEINSKDWSHEDYLYVQFGSNVKRKSRKVLKY